MSPGELRLRVPLGVTREYAIYRCGRIELHFEPWRSGRLVIVHTEVHTGDDDGNGRVPTKGEPT